MMYYEHTNKNKNEKASSSRQSLGEEKNLFLKFFSRSEEHFLRISLADLSSHVIDWWMLRA